MKEKLKFLPSILLAFLAVLMVFYVWFFHFSEYVEEASVIKDVTLTVNGETKKAVLPASLSGLPHGTKVTVSFSPTVENGYFLFFGSVYSPLIITADGTTIYEYGTSGTYPSFFGDPPTQYDSVPLPAGDVVDISMHYISPNERTTLSIHAPVMGSAEALRHYLIDRYGISMLLSLLFILLGAILIALSVFFTAKEINSTRLLAPGLLFLCAGAWQFGENTLSVYITDNPSLLYVIDFLGLFLLVIPLYRMGITYLNLRTDRLLIIIQRFMILSVIVTIVLQLSGTVSFHRSLYYYHVLLPAAIIVLTVNALYEFLRFGNKMAGIFFLPFLILAATAILELLNYRLHFLPQFSTLFQAGLFVFLVSMGILSAFYIRTLYTLQFKALALENEVKLQEQTISAQKMRNELLLDHFEEIRRQRHDIRHHLHTISDMLQEGEADRAADYIHSLENDIPSYTPDHFCDNVIVNAAMSYYCQQAKENGIEFRIRAQVPEANPHISDANLCVVFGNLLENAIEACCRIKSGSRYIRLEAQIRGEVLFISMNNSCDGNVYSKDGRFYSSKRGGFGTGLRSVSAIAERHNGSTHFEALENQFRSEVYFRL